jgi:hypothetical protein
MGFLKNLKAGIEAAQAASAQPVDDTPAFINPWPQDEVDRLLAGSGTIRAILLGYRHQVLEGNERIGAMGVKVRLRPRGPAGTLGEEVTVKATMSSWNARLLTPGMDIPVERDPATGAVTKVASKQLAAELEGRADEAKKGNSGWTLDPDVEGMIEVAKAAFGTPAPAAPAAAAPSDPRLAPVEGISYETYVAVCASIKTHGAPNGEDSVAQKHDVRAHTWAAISNVWKNRIALDPELTAKFETDLAAAL